MSLDNFIPQVWSARLLETLKKAHVFANVVNTDYEGEISNYGDTVKINAIGSVTVKDYTKNNDIDDPEDLDAAQTILTIDQQKYFHFQVDDIDRAQQRPKIMDAAMNEAGFALADEADSHIAGLHTEAGEEVEKNLSTHDDVYDAIAEVAEELDKNNVPREGRWLVVPPFINTSMTIAGIMETAGSIDANEINRDGYVGRLLGFDIYMSNNLKDDNTWTFALGGTRKAISYAEQILDMEAYRPEKRFADAVKGLHVYGAKVIYPDALVRLKVQSV